MIRLAVALAVAASCRSLGLAAESAPALGQLLQAAPAAVEPVPLPRLSPSGRRRVAETTVLLRFKKSTVIAVGGMKVEVAVTDGDRLKRVESLGLSILSIDPQGVWRVVSPSLDAEATAARLEAENVVLWASPGAFVAPKERRLFVKFRTSLRIDVGGIQAEIGVREDDVARVLRENGLVVLEERGEGGFAVTSRGSVSDALERLAADRFVLTASRE
ncbi:MAG: hypothetical protein HY554_18380 [Elusimicrobia bacterium]|nr:hypothetical protein [Elusimicrobiota bacterium]